MADLNVETFETGSRTKIPGLKSPESVAEARTLLGDLTVRYLAGELSEHQLRTATYAVNGMVKALVHEKAAELERRIVALERATE